MSNVEAARQCEECLVNVWPAVTTLIMEGWAVRFAHGYSSRANSASAIVAGASVSVGLLRHIEGLYRREGLKPRFRLTPVADAGTEKLLLAQGYRVLDESMTMTLPLARGGWQSDPRVNLAGTPGQEWLHGISIRQQASKRSPEHLRDIVTRVRLPVAFATLHEAEPLGFGLCVVDRTWAELGSIMIDAGHRGRGLGEALVRSLLAFAAGENATSAFLQVDLANAAAIRLYERLGFAPLYRYKTMVLDS